MSGKREDFRSPGWKGERTPQAGIVGLGLIGGSWAGALAKLGWQVWAVDCNQESLAAARTVGWIQEGWTELPEQFDVDLLILATPIALVSESFAQIAGRVPQGALITDVGSLKGEICELVESEALSGVCFIGGHPMTGSERHGFSQAHPELFQGYPYVLCPDSRCPDVLVRQFSELVGTVGAKVIFREHGEHDREVAMVSHVPHLLALALALSASEGFSEGKPLELAGRSFRDFTRLVDSSPDMWREIMLRNAPAILSSLDVWEDKLQEIRRMVQNSDGEGITNVFERAQAARGRVLSRR